MLLKFIQVFILLGSAFGWTMDSHGSPLGVAAAGGSPESERSDRRRREYPVAFLENDLGRNVRRRVGHVDTQGTPRAHKLKIATFNIISGRSGRLEAATRSMQQLNVDIALLTEAKLTGDVYTRFSFDYHVIATNAVHANLGGVALCWRDSAFYEVEGISKHGPNVISCELVSGGRRWLVIGAYIPPSEDDGSTCTHILAAQMRRPQLPVILLGDLNVDFDQLWIDAPRNMGIAAMVASLGVEDVISNFRQTRRHADGITWRQNRNNGEVSSRCDYILSSSSRIFTAVRIVTPRHYDSDHNAVVATMIPTPKQQHRRYLNGRKAFPLKVVDRDRTEVDGYFDSVLSRIPAVHGGNHREWRSWISENTWRLVDQRAALRRSSGLDRTRELNIITGRIRRSIRQDRKRRTEEAGAEIERCLNTNDVRGAWSLLKRWYNHNSKSKAKPSITDFRETEAVYTALYSAVAPPGDPLPVHYFPVPIPDHIPEEEEIVAAVQRLRRGKAPGPSGLTVDHVKVWATERNSTAWLEFLQLVQHCFTTGTLPQRVCFSTLVLIPKSDGGVRGIGLLETVWKVISMIIKERLAARINFDDSLHGFRPQRGTGTAIVEARMNLDYSIQQGRALYQVFLDLKKAYDTLDRQRTLQLLQAYGLGPNLLGILSAFWNNLQLVPRQGGYHGLPIRSARGVTQGDPLSPIIFNVVVDAVVRCFRANLALGSVSCIFYADDGWVAGHSQELVQLGVDTLTDLFGRMGLAMNPSKTVAMVGHPGSAVHTISTPAYKRRLTGDGDTYSARKRQVVECPECNKAMQGRSLPQHLLLKHNIFHRPLKRRKLLDVYSLDPVTYRVDLAGRVREPCPVPDCVGGASTGDAMRSHFAFKHPRDVIIIEQEGLLPRCQRCDMFVKASSLATTHHASKRCEVGSERKRKRLLELDYLSSREIEFSVSGTTIEAVEVFRYLGRPLTTDSSDGTAVVYNLNRARRRWAQVSRVLTRQGANSKIAGYFYKAVCQSVLLYGCETWVVSQSILRSLEGFHHQVARRLSFQRIRLDPNTGEWIYPPAHLALQSAGLFSMPEYLQRRRQYLVNWVQNRPLFRNCNQLTGGAGGNQRQYWWSTTT